MPNPVTKWEQMVTRASRVCSRVFGDGTLPEVDGGAASIVYTHKYGQPYAIPAIFQAVTEEVDLDTGAAVLSNKPVLDVAMADLLQVPEEGDLVTIRGVPYTVQKAEFDGQGTVTLRLWCRR